nr:hypothetical protein [Bacteroidota bacterium]
KVLLAWVLYDLLKQHAGSGDFNMFSSYLNEIKDLGLGEDNKMLTNQLPWEIGKAVFEFTKNDNFDIYKIAELYNIVSSFEFSRPSKGYSFLFKAFHKGLKESPKYIDFADWWDINNFMREDYQGSKPDAVKQIVPVAEQAYVTYAHHLLEMRIEDPETHQDIQDIRKIKKFLLPLGQVIKRHADFQHAAYYMARLLLAIGHENNPLSALLPFARQRQTEYWVWDVVADAYPDDYEKQLAFLGKSILCRGRDTDLLKIRERLVEAMVGEKYLSEAKAEIERIEKICQENNLDISENVSFRMGEDWFGETISSPDLTGFYRHYAKYADAIVFGNIPEETIVVEFVNPAKKILNFVQSRQKQGFFKYGRFMKYVNVGDVLKVRMQETNQAGRYNIFTLKKVKDETVDGVMITFYGNVVNKSDKPFGFVNDMFIIPDLYIKHNLRDGDDISGKAVIAYNKKKEEWGWKVISIDPVSGNSYNPGRYNPQYD